MKSLTMPLRGKSHVALDIECGKRMSEPFSDSNGCFSMSFHLLPSYVISNLEHAFASDRYCAARAPPAVVNSTTQSSSLKFVRWLTPCCFGLWLLKQKTPDRAAMTLRKFTSSFARRSIYFVLSIKEKYDGKCPPLRRHMDLKGALSSLRQRRFVSLRPRLNSTPSWAPNSRGGFLSY